MEACQFDTDLNCPLCIRHVCNVRVCTINLYMYTYFRICLESYHKREREKKRKCAIIIKYLLISTYYK